MRRPSLFWKTVFVILSVSIALSDLQLWYAAAMAWMTLFFWLFLLSLFSKRISSLVPNPPSVLFLPVCLFLLTGLIREVQEPDRAGEEWFLFAGSPQNPSYDRAFLVEVELIEFVSPGNYIADITILEKQKQISFGRYTTIKKISHSPRLRSFLSINFDRLMPGCVLIARLTGRAAPSALDDSGFSSYLRRKRADSLIRLSRKYNLLSYHCNTGIRSKIQAEIQKSLNENLNQTASAIATGLLFGKSGYLDRELKTKARHLGILHLFAASGLHLGIFYACLYLPLAYFFGKKSRVSLTVPLLPAFVYLWLLDFPVSLSRAFLFLSLFALRAYLHRAVSTSHHLLNTAIVLLVWQPYETASVSGALSFGAVGGILYFYRYFEEDLYSVDVNRKSGFFISKIFAKILIFIRTQLSISLSASLFTSPTIAFVFRGLPFFSILANCFLVPLTGILLPVLYFTVLGHFLNRLLSLSFESWIWWPVNRLFDLFLVMTEQLSHFSLFVEHSSKWNGSFFFTILVASLALLYRQKRENWKTRKSRFVVWLLVLLPILAGILYAILFVFGYS